MSATSISTSSASAKKLYEEMTFKAAIKESFWMSSMNSGDMNSVLYINSKLEKQAGDRVSIDLVPRFVFNAITSAGTVEGNEGSVTPYTFNLTLEEYNVAIRYKGKLDAMRPAWDLPAIHKERVQQRGAEVIDENLFDALQATAATKVFYGGSATSVGTLTATDLLTPRQLTKAKTWMETGGARTQNAIRKVKIGGRGHYVALIHNDVFFDLWNDTTIQQSYREAMDRGPDNPLFKTADLIWQDVLVFKHENIDIYTNGGAGSIAYSTGFLMGAGAMAWAWGQRPELVTKTFDYDREVGHNFNYVAAAGRPAFNSKDYGLVGLTTARSQVSDA